jgi:hypothetical protein
LLEQFGQVLNITTSKNTSSNLKIERMNEEEEKEYLIKAQKERSEYHKYLERVKKFKKMNPKHNKQV